MNIQTLNQLPYEMRREIYNYVPVTTCIVCNQMVVSYNKNMKHKVCSMYCLYQYSNEISKDIALYNVSIPLFNLYAICNYMYLKCFFLMILGGIFLGYNIVVIYSMVLITNAICALGHLFLVTGF
jgi:hypothetical protein